nr:helix-turn-helix transcriptional regulator [Niveispirillum sp. SYP-B3756]
MLLADLAKPPSLRQLAGAAGLNEKRLNEGFRALYGATVFECLRNARLEKGRQLLFDDQLPLKTIAWQVGYTHVNNFITAYRNHFGEPPRRHQNGGVEE